MDRIRMLEHLLLDDTVDAYAASMHASVDLLADHLREVDRPVRGVEVEEAQARVAAIDLDIPSPGGLGAALDEVRDLYLREAVHFHLPDYVAHLNCPVTLASLAAEVLVSGINTSVDTWDQSVTATAMEQRLIDWTGQRIGLDACAGVFTSGGTASNLQALTMARGAALERLGARQDTLRLLVTEQTHFSAVKAARLLGLAHEAIVTVPTESGGAMDPLAARGAIEWMCRTGQTPMALVATAGTTDLGLIDPLPALGDLCRSEDVWLHVDAAYGGGLLTSRRRRHLLEGIEQADSVTVDYHKTFFLPVSASAVIVRDPQTLKHVRHHAAYLNPSEASVPNLVDSSLQTTRRFDALKLWTTLRAVGSDTLGDMLDTVVDLAADLAVVLEDDPDFELAARPTLSTLVFRYAPAHLTDSVLDEVQPRLRAALFAEGRAVVAGTVLWDRTWLKFTLLNPSADVDQLGEVIERVRSAGADAVREVLQEQCWTRESQRAHFYASEVGA